MLNSQEFLTNLLTARGIAPHEQESFLHPDFVRDTHDPMLLKDMQVAAERIVAAIASQEKIVVFGDYDADGVPATALLVRALRELGANVEPIIPLRSDGYGLTEASVARIEAANCTLLITVDNGTVAGPLITELVNKGIATIVVDHHEPHGDTVAHDALALINPKQVNCSYPFKELCACALAWKLAVACYRASNRDEAQLRWLLDLVAVSTVGDLVPLIGENRTLVVFGLKVLQKTRNLGLLELAEVADVNLATVSAGDIGFRLAPRLNAPSRMHNEHNEEEHAAVGLLITADRAQARKHARYLHAQNSQRQGLVEKTLKEAVLQVGENPRELCIVVGDTAWSTGVIGLVASKLVERYRRPAIVFAEEQGALKGSVRSVEGAHALDMLDAASSYIEQFGGHAKAAGLSLKLGTTVSEFSNAVQAGLLGKVTLNQLSTSLIRNPDANLTLADIDLELADAISQLEPFGMGFPTPAFRVEATVRGLKNIGKEGQHRSCMLEEANIQRRAVAWGQRGESLYEGLHTAFDVTIEAQEWRDVRSVNLGITHVYSTAS